MKKFPLILSLSLATLLAWCPRDDVNAQLSPAIKRTPSQYLKANLKKTAGIPLLLVTAGMISMTDNEILDRAEIYEERNERMPGFRTHVDDFLQYAPIAAAYGLNAVGIKGEHDFMNRTALLIKSELFMTAMVWPLKKLTNVPRPDTGAPTSFPSGHTAQAFAAATFFYREYGKTHPGYSVLAYTTAAGIGILRVMNNRHWASDVLVGAGIGILATNLAYLTHQNRWGHNVPSYRHKIKTDIALSPVFHKGSIGAAMGIRFK